MNSATLNWNRQWVHPFESLWSLFNKLRYANAMSINDLFKTLGTSYVKGLKGRTGAYHYDLYRIQSLDEEEIVKKTHFNFLWHHRYYLQQIIDRLPKYRFNYEYYFRKHLAFCKSCMENGYHSILHQFKFLHECPFHNEMLQLSCPNCKTGFSYQLEPKPFYSQFQSPYECKCGYFLLSKRNTQQIFLLWQHKVGNFIHEDVLNFFELSESEIKRAKNVSMLKNYNLEHSEGLFALYNEMVSDRKSKKSFIFSSPAIHQVKGIKETETVKEYSTQNKEYNFVSRFVLRQIRDEEFNHELNDSIQMTINAVAKRIRKTILLKHKTCLGRLSSNWNNDPKQSCPYALAYVYWRYSVQKYPYINWIISYNSPNYETKKYLDFPFQPDVFRQIYDHWKMGIQDVTLESWAAAKWLLNRSIAHCAYYIFFYYLSRIEKAGIYELYNDYKTLDCFNIPFFMNYIPQSRSEPIEFHWMNQQINIPHLTCPFDSVKKRRDPQRNLKIERQVYYQRLVYGDRYIFGKKNRKDSRDVKGK